MEFLVVSSTKLKVRLSEEEIVKYSLADIDSEKVEKGMRRGLWQLIDIAKERCGFAFSGEKLLVQFYKTEGGGELFITKLVYRSQKTEKLLEGASNVTLLNEKYEIFRFLTADMVIRAFERLKKLRYEEISLYYSDDGCFYVTVTTREGDTSVSSPLLEYGEEIAGNMISAVIEHSKLIGTSDTLAPLFD